MVSFLDTIRVLLLDDESEEENLSESDPEDHIEADPAYQTESDDEVSVVNEE